MDKFFTDKHCARCGKEVKVFTMSRFNTDKLCMDCVEKEKQHPKYKEAVYAEMEAIRYGYLDFEGIGLPDDLK